MPPALPRGTRFVKPTSGTKKYTAIVPVGKRSRRVSFGHRDYEHYKDAVPASLGGQKWTHKNHRNPSRRANYRKRHGSMRCKRSSQRCVDVKYSPAWFSYHFLW